MRARLVVVAAVVVVVAVACGRSPFERSASAPTPVEGFGVLPIPSEAPPIYDPGDGHDGPLQVSSANVPINLCERVSSHPAANVLTLASSGDAFRAGARVLALLVQNSFAMLDDTHAVASVVETANAGHWELGRVLSTNGTQVTLEDPLTGNYATDGIIVGQLCTMPEWSDVVVTSSGSLVPRTRWDGARGGVLAFFVSGTLTLNGALDARFAGFRGGAARANDGGGSLSSDVCSLATEKNGGGKGEGLDSGALALSCRGNLANAGGGGDRKNGGGGGGGGGGQGGFGGQNEAALDNSRGFPGAAVSAAVPAFLTFGGGGGAGQQDDTGGPDGSGGPGGGLVLVFANAVVGSGSIFVDGSNGTLGGVSAGNHGDGAGGAGAGGTVWIEAFSDAGFHGAVSARGGNGGSAQIDDGNNEDGPGGGGGGGRVYLTNVPGALVTVSGGTAGVSEMGDAHGATPGARGTAVRATH